MSKIERNQHNLDIMIKSFGETAHIVSPNLQFYTNFASFFMHFILTESNLKFLIRFSFR